MISKKDFGEDFYWGVSSSAFQTEGVFSGDGKGRCIWEEFASQKKKIKNGGYRKVATSFYENYEEDISWIDWMRVQNFRFSIAWSRVLPEGIGRLNQAGLDFYDRLIDSSLEKGIKPWITLYHWDLPQALEQKGGWTNRDVLHWLEEYIQLCLHKYSDRANNWMVLNEPTAFTALGYYLGIHAPGKKGLKNFLPAVHHAALAQGLGGRIIKSHDINLQVGTTFSLSHVKPYTRKAKDLASMKRVDALLNRLFLEPLLGLGYPMEDLPILKRMRKYMLPKDETDLAFDFDFIGVQNYSREVVAHSYFTPIISAKQITPKQRGKRQTTMGWEYYPKGIYKVLNRLSQYENLPPVIITESGVAVEDVLTNKQMIHDKERIQFLKKSLKGILRARENGLDVRGYFIWSLTDNFEWAEGFHPRFGLIYIDYKNQKRVPKDSSYWYKNFLK